MTKSKDALVNNVLTEVAHLISNMGRLQSVPKESKDKTGFTDFSKIFCDSIIFWGLYNGAKEDTMGTAIGRYIGELRHVFEELELGVESIKPTNPGSLKDDDDVPRKVRRRHRRECSGEYEARYVAIKVSLNYCQLGHTVHALENVRKHLAKKCLVIHDIDFAQDCGYITMRTQLERHIRENKAGEIINDRKKVGDHCVTWRGKGDYANIRYKVYNKFVQQLESAEVRKSLGSRMENLVEQEGKFADHMERYRDRGFSRMELTFYGSKLLSTKEYRARMEETREMLDTCKTWKCSHENQWRQRAQLIQSVVAVHIPKRKVFAYCHWWNAITTKKYGYMWNQVKASTVPLLLANYSFNDRPIYYFKADVVDDCAVITERAIKKRVAGSTAITMVAGGRKGMFPSQKSHVCGVNEFRNVGLVEVDNISIAWPENRHDKRTPPVAETVEYKADGSNFVEHLTSIHCSSYHAIYSTLRPGAKYTVIAAGMTKFRGEMAWHFITECGLKVRGGESFRKCWNGWRKPFLGEDYKVGTVDGVERMTFTAVKKARIQGRTDMRCEL